jgi:hypothetical protein
MSAAKLNSANARFKAAPILSGVPPKPVFTDSGSPRNNPLTGAENLPPFAVSPLFLDAMRDGRCPHCDLESAVWSTPVPSTERMVNFNAYQTAIINTCAEALARIYGKDEWRLNYPAAIVEVLRLFLLTDPAALAMKWHTRPAKVERGTVTQVDFDAVEVISTPQTSADPVESAAPEVVAGEIEGGIDDLYDEPADPDKLYGDGPAGMYDEKDGN